MYKPGCFNTITVPSKQMIPSLGTPLGKKYNLSALLMLMKEPSTVSKSYKSSSVLADEEDEVDKLLVRASQRFEEVNDCD